VRWPSGPPTPTILQSRVLQEKLFWASGSARTALTGGVQVRKSCTPEKKRIFPVPWARIRAAGQPANQPPAGGQSGSRILPGPRPWARKTLLSEPRLVHHLICYARLIKLIHLMNATAHELEVVHFDLLMNHSVYKLDKSRPSRKQASGTGVGISAQSWILYTTCWNTDVFLECQEMLGRGGRFQREHTGFLMASPGRIQSFGGAPRILRFGNGSAKQNLTTLASRGEPSVNMSLGIWWIVSKLQNIGLDYARLGSCMVQGILCPSLASPSDKGYEQW